MSKQSGQQSVCVESSEFLKPSVPQLSNKSGKSTSNTLSNLSGSCGDIHQASLKHPASQLHRDDSVSSKSSFKPLFPTKLQSFDTSSSFSISQGFVPQTEKTLALLDIIVNTLKEMKKKYSEYLQAANGTEAVEGGDICSKVDNRIDLLQSLKREYERLMEEKEVEMKAIQSTVALATSVGHAKEELDMLDCENYWTVCREMCIVESKLERCAGKLQFQIMELDYLSRVNVLDQYELSIRLNDISKFKTRIKVEKKGHQIWDNTTFVLNPTIEDTLDVKFVELKTLNKSLVLLEKKVPFVNNLILADPSIYTFWLTPVGTIKLKVIVQWNAQLDDPDLPANFNQIDNKFHSISVKDGVSLRDKTRNVTGLFSRNRLSVNFSNLFRSDGFDRTSGRGSMENITELVEKDEHPRVNLRKGSLDRKKEKVKAEYLDDSIVAKAISTTVIRNAKVNPATIVVTNCEHETNVISETIVESDLLEPICEDALVTSLGKEAIEGKKNNELILEELPDKGSEREQEEVLVKEVEDVIDLEVVDESVCKGVEGGENVVITEVENQRVRIMGDGEIDGNRVTEVMISEGDIMMEGVNDGLLEGEDRLSDGIKSDCLRNEECKRDVDCVLDGWTDSACGDAEIDRSEHCINSVTTTLDRASPPLPCDLISSTVSHSLDPSSTTATSS